MTDTVLLTGATGFLGMEVLVRLLERPDVEVITVVRAADQAGADERMRTVFGQLYEQPDPARVGRVRAVAGDLTTPGLGLAAADRQHIVDRVGTVAHCAASISFDLPLPEALLINTEGTSHVLALAGEIEADHGLAQFLHVSTAYVSGDHEGRFSETDLDIGQGFRNSYEESKLRGEQVVHDAGLASTIVRPSIVVGDRLSGWTPAFNVLYWPLQAFARGLLDAIPARPDGVIDVVPIDYIADAVVSLLAEPGGKGTLNLVAGDKASTVEELIEMGAKEFDRPRPTLVDAGEGLELEEASVYAPYFDVQTRFDDRLARELLVPAGIETPPLETYFPALIDYATFARWGKRNLSREAARARRAEALA